MKSRQVNGTLPFHTAMRVVVKALLLFIIANLLFAWFYPVDALGRASAYNHLFPGRKRLPYGENPGKAYNLSLFNLEAMFSSHELAGMPKPPGEYRVILIGDSSTWGYLLPPEKTLAETLNQLAPVLPDGRLVRFYNLGYPVMSVTKDLLLLERALHYQPDMILWPLTLESLPYDKQLFPPLLVNNPEETKALLSRNGLKLDENSAPWVETNWFSRTLIGSRRQLADLLRLQLFGALWAATGVDQEISEKITSRQEDLERDVSFHNLQQPLLKSDLAFDVLDAGVVRAGKVPVLFINEPMFISAGENSDIRYNFFYPRWAYDAYRQLLTEEAARNKWNYLDLWNAVSPEEFTNTAIHMTPQGTKDFAEQILPKVLELAGIDQ